MEPKISGATSSVIPLLALKDPHLMLLCFIVKQYWRPEMLCWQIVRYIVGHAILVGENIIRGGTETENEMSDQFLRENAILVDYYGMTEDR